jgi:hypothetical protein
LPHFRSSSQKGCDGLEMQLCWIENISMQNILIEGFSACDRLKQSNSSERCTKLQVKTKIHHGFDRRSVRSGHVGFF